MTKEELADRIVLMLARRIQRENPGAVVDILDEDGNAVSLEEAERIVREVEP